MNISNPGRMIVEQIDTSVITPPNGLLFLDTNQNLTNQNLLAWMDEDGEEEYINTTTTFGWSGDMIATANIGRQKVLGTFTVENGIITNFTPS